MIRPFSIVRYEGLDYLISRYDHKRGTVHLTEWNHSVTYDAIKRYAPQSSTHLVLPITKFKRRIRILFEW